MPQSIPKGLTREHVLKALADLDAGIEHSFGRATGYELVHDGKRYVRSDPTEEPGHLAVRIAAARLLRSIPESERTLTFSFEPLGCPLPGSSIPIAMTSLHPSSEFVVGPTLHLFVGCL
jgi:hypothetical protein